MDAFIQGFGAQFARGAALTVGLAFCSLVLGSLIGLGAALGQLRGPALLRGVARAYAAIGRGIPDLLVIFVIYFGGAVAVSWAAGRPVDVDPFAGGVVALGLVAGAYLAEIFRGAILAVPRGQTEGAQALGIRPWAVFRRVVLPQAWRLALPPFGNQAIILTKQTSLVSVIGLEEIMRKANVAAGYTREPFTWFAVAAVTYLLITAAMTGALRFAERRAAVGAGG